MEEERGTSEAFVEQLLVVCCNLWYYSGNQSGGCDTLGVTTSDQGVMRELTSDIVRLGWQWEPAFCVVLLHFLQSFPFWIMPWKQTKLNPLAGSSIMSVTRTERKCLCSIVFNKPVSTKYRVFVPLYVTWAFQPEIPFQTSKSIWNLHQS